MDERPATGLVEWARRSASWLALALVLVFVVVPRVSPFEGLNQYLTVGERISEWMIARVQRLFTEYGYYVVFFGVLMENSMFLGLLVPGVIILILGGLAAENGSINVWLVLGLGVTATLIGDTISYAIGRLGWARVLERGATAGVMRQVRETLESNRRWIILAYHFAGYSRMVGPAAAGVFRIPYRQWAPLDYLGATLWVIAFTSVGVAMGLFGVEFGDTKRMVRLLELFLTVAVVGAVVLAFYRAARPRRGEPAAPAVVTVDDP